MSKRIFLVQVFKMDGYICTDLTGDAWIRMQPSLILSGVGVSGHWSCAADSEG